MMDVVRALVFAELVLTVLAALTFYAYVTSKFVAWRGRVRGRRTRRELEAMSDEKGTGL